MKFQADCLSEAIFLSTKYCRKQFDYWFSILFVVDYSYANDAT